MQAPEQEQTSVMSFSKFLYLLTRLGSSYDYLRFASFFPDDVCAATHTAPNPSHELTLPERIAFLDTLALVGAIINPSPNGSDLLLARLALLCHGRLQAAVADDDKSWESRAALATAFCHGGRIVIEYDAQDAKQANLFNRLTQVTDLATRRFSTHDLVYDPQSQRFKERKKKFRKAAHQYGMSAPMFGENSVHPLTKRTVSSDGSHGALLILHHPPSDKTAHRGAIAVGLEGSQALRRDPFGQLHSPTGAAPKICVTGSGKKFPQAAQDVGVTFASPDAKHPKNDLLTVDLTSTGDIALPDDSEELRRAAIAALFPEGARPESDADFTGLSCALRAVNLMNPPIQHNNVFSRSWHWCKHNPWRAAGWIFLGCVLAAVATVFTGGLAPLAILGTWAVASKISLLTAIFSFIFVPFCLGIRASRGAKNPVSSSSFTTTSVLHTLVGRDKNVAASTSSSQQHEQPPASASPCKALHPSCQTLSHHQPPSFNLAMRI